MFPLLLTISSFVTSKLLRIIWINSNLCFHSKSILSFLKIVPQIALTLSWRGSLSDRHQSIYLLCKSIGWFLYERIKEIIIFVWPIKIRRIISLHYTFLYNSKDTNHRHISLTGTDHCNSKLTKNIRSGKDILFFFLFVFQYFRKTAKKSKSKGLTLDRHRVFCKLQYCSSALKCLQWSSLENYTSNDTAQHNTRQHNTTRDNTSTTRDNTSTTRLNKKQHECKTY